MTLYDVRNGCNNPDMKNPMMLTFLQESVRRDNGTMGNTKNFIVNLEETNVYDSDIATRNENTYELKETKAGDQSWYTQ